MIAACGSEPATDGSDTDSEGEAGADVTTLVETGSTTVATTDPTLTTTEGTAGDTELGDELPGDLVYCARDSLEEGRYLRAVNADGSGGTNLTDATDRFIVRLSWSGDGRYLAWTDVDAVMTNMFTTWEDERLHVLGPGALYEPLQGQDPLYYFNAQWAPVGASLATSFARYVDPRQWQEEHALWVLDPLGGGVALNATLTDDSVAAVEWSKDGSQLAYVVSSHGELVDGAVFVSTADASSTYDITSGLAPALSTFAWTLAPDGQRVAVVMDHGGEQRLYLVRSDGASATIVDSDPSIFGLRWSPDSAYLSYGRGATVHSGVLREVDGAREWIREGTTTFDWSPTAPEVLYTIDDDVYLLDVVTDEERLVASGVTPGSWSPDGALFLARTDDGESHVVYDRVGAVTLELPGVAGPPEWSPDSSLLAIAASSSVWIEPLDGGETIYLGFGSGPLWRPVEGVPSSYVFMCQ
ncbi:MAG: hypothetical protein R3A51_17595 [Nannocystaceae bacterium]